MAADESKPLIRELTVGCGVDAGQIASLVELDPPHLCGRLRRMDHEGKLPGGRPSRPSNEEEPRSWHLLEPSYCGFLRRLGERAFGRHVARPSTAHLQQ